MLSADVATIPGFQIRARLLHAYPIIWRRFLFRNDNTFADLHYALQIAFNWTDFYSHHFKLRGKVISSSFSDGATTDSAEIALLADFDFKQNHLCWQPYPSKRRFQTRMSNIITSTTIRHYPKSIVLESELSCYLSLPTPVSMPFAAFAHL